MSFESWLRFLETLGRISPCEMREKVLGHVAKRVGDEQGTVAFDYPSEHPQVYHRCATAVLEKAERGTQTSIVPVNCMLPLHLFRNVAKD